MNKVEKTARAMVRERSGGVCEVCGTARATNYQHRKNRSQAGEWSVVNGLDVCGSGTTGCHGWIHANPTKSYERGWMVHSWDDPANVPVRIGCHLVFLTPTGGYRGVAE